MRRLRSAILDESFGLSLRTVLRAFKINIIFENLFSYKLVCYNGEEGLIHRKIRPWKVG